MTEYKVVLVGSGGVGKTTFVERHTVGSFRKQYQATPVVEVKSLTFSTNHGLLKFYIWDIAGQSKYTDHSVYYTAADGAIVMFSTDSRPSYREVPVWFQDVRKTCGNIPTVICGNKIDLPNPVVKPETITVHRRLAEMSSNPVMYYSISAKSNHNYEKPFLWLARQLTGYDDLRFVEMPVV